MFFIARSRHGFFENVAQAGSALDTVAAIGLGVDHAGFDIGRLDGHPFTLVFNVRFGNHAFASHGFRFGEHIHAWLLRQSADGLAPLPRSA